MQTTTTVQYYLFSTEDFEVVSSIIMFESKVRAKRHTLQLGFGFLQFAGFWGICFVPVCNVSSTSCHFVHVKASVLCARVLGACVLCAVFGAPICVSPCHKHRCPVKASITSEFGRCFGSRSPLLS